MNSTTLRIQARWIVGPGDAAAPAILGAKAARLSALSAQGLPVPRWIVLTTAATDAVLAPVREGIEAIVREVPPGDAAAARDASERIARSVRAAPWPRVLRDQLSDRVRRLRADGGLAVRSSAADEDGTRASYAGQLTTALNVSASGLESAIAACWASAWTDRAILYRQARGLASADVPIAVVIQELVAATASGVAFTADPLTGAPTHVVVAGYGLGEGVVSDQVECDEYVRRPPDPGWRSTVRRKAARLAPRGDGGPGTELVEMPPKWRDRPVLTPLQLDRLSTLLDRIEREAGRPQDVEWAIDENGLVFILQARPITAMPEGEVAIWDDANIGESYPGVTLPLTFSYVRSVYQRVFGRALREIGASAATLDRARDPLSRLVGTIRGRLYMNVRCFYDLFRLVPGLESGARRWETAFGIRPEFAAAGAARPLGALRTHLILAARLLSRSGDVRRLERRAAEMRRGLEAEPFAGRSFEALLSTYEAIDREFLDEWALVVFNDLYATYFTDRLAVLCSGGERGERAGTRDLDLHHRLFCGEERMESVGPLRSVVDLAWEANGSPAVSALLRSGLPDEEVWRRILASEETSSFRGRAIEHIREHGYRTVDELKLEARSLSDAPWTLVSILRNYLDLGLSVFDLSDRERETRIRAERELRDRFRGHPLRLAYVRWILARARRAVTDRENMALARSKAHALLRGLFRAMGSDLARRAELGEASDIFYLTLEDLRAYAAGGMPEGGLVELVAARRARYAEFSAGREPPHRIVCRGSVYRTGLIESARGSRRGCELDAANTSGGQALKGTPCSPGRVRGLARVLRQPSPGIRVDGEILVAPVTDPGWMFLMLAARGLIVERGSILSHTAIIGRELGIPTIVAVEDAVSRIETGDEIEMDGATGEVRILRRHAGSRDGEADGSVARAAAP